MFATPLSIKTIEKNIPFYANIKSKEEKTFELFVDAL
jgi:hypothetical protein